MVIFSHRANICFSVDLPGLNHAWLPRRMGFNQLMKILYIIRSAVLSMTDVNEMGLNLGWCPDFGIRMRVDFLHTTGVFYLA